MPAADHRGDFALGLQDGVRRRERVEQVVVSARPGVARGERDDCE